MTNRYSAKLVMNFWVTVKDRVTSLFLYNTNTLSAISSLKFLLGMLGFDWVSDHGNFVRSWSVAAIKRTKKINANNSVAYRMAA